MLAGLFIVGIKGNRIDKELQDFLKTYKPLGIILFSKNIPPSYEETREFIFSIKGIVKNILISIDEEGGRVKRIEPPFELPPARKIGELYERGEISDDEIIELGKKLGSFLSYLGIDINFAPVVDLYGYNNTVIGDRAYSQDPQITCKIAEAFANGMLSGGILPVAKHFPGHGLVSEDSHITLPISEPDQEEIQKHILPFARISNSVYGIMTSHIIIKGIDNNLPCTLSPVCLQKLKEFFHGFIISDDLCMDALKNYGDIPELAIKAFLAGCDILLICSDNYNLLAKTFENFAKFIKENRKEIQSRLDEAVKKVSLLKKQISLLKKGKLKLHLI